MCFVAKTMLQITHSIVLGLCFFSNGTRKGKNSEQFQIPSAEDRKKNSPFSMKTTQIVHPNQQKQHNNNILDLEWSCWSPHLDPTEHLWSDQMIYAQKKASQSDRFGKHLLPCTSPNRVLLQQIISLDMFAFMQPHYLIIFYFFS